MPSRQQIRTYIQTENASHQVVVWSKSYCPYCRAAKKLIGSLVEANDVVIHEIDVEKDGYLIQQELQALTGQRTVPSIFVNNHHVGGNDSLQQAAQDGSLRMLLSTSNEAEPESEEKENAETNSSKIKVPPKAIVDENKTNNVVAWSKSYCPNCHSAP